MVKKKNQLLEEIVKLDKVLETGVFCTDITSNKVSEVISGLLANIKSKCPLIFYILETLFLTKSDNANHEGRRELDALHAIGLLSSLTLFKPGFFWLSMTGGVDSTPPPENNVTVELGQ